MSLTAAERKRLQRKRDRLLGWTEVTVKVSAQKVQEVRDFAASLPEPPPLVDPDQLSLLEDLNLSLSDGRRQSKP